MVAAPQKQVTQSQPTPPKISLKNLIRGRLQQPIRLLLYGVEGIGKSTLGADAQAPIFIGAEDGTSQLDVVRFATPEKWEDVLEAVRVLTMDKHDFKTVVFDTIDWMEPLLWDFICKRDKKHSVEDYGYGKGYAAALDEWRPFLAALERLRVARQMHVIFLAHSWVKTFKNPEGEDFDRYELKIHNKAAGLIKEWVDAVLFTNYQTFAVENEKTKRVKGVSDGTRLIYTNRTPAYDAKNRYSLPPTLPLSFEELWNAIQAGQPADPVHLAAEIRRKAKELGGEYDGQKTTDFLKAHAQDASKLAQLDNRLTALLDEREAKRASNQVVETTAAESQQ